MEETPTAEPEVIERDRALELRKPSIPTNINELASLEQNRGKAIIEQRTEILEALRSASIKLTAPRDWTLFRNTDGVVTGFLGDEGCDRIKKLWGIQIDNLGQMDRIPGDGVAADGAFAYRITGDGHCKMTGESVYEMEGVRYSNERYAEEKAEGIQREVAVRKAARANLDGGITRELAGMKSVPLEELETAWKGTWKKTEMCNKGRGFGSKDQRLGQGDASSGNIDPADIPECGACPPGTKLVFRPKGNPPFWGCPNYSKHPKDKVIVNHEDLLKKIADKKAAAQEQRQPGEDG
jgi:hypothetical protein